MREQHSHRDHGGSSLGYDFPRVRTGEFGECLFTDTSLGVVPTVAVAL